MKKGCLLLIVFVLLIGCETIKMDRDIGAYGEIQSVFNQAEINDLRIILNFFDDVVCKSENVEKSNVLEAYEKYFKRMDETSTDMNVDIRIDGQRQQNLFQKIGSPTFNQIWTKSLQNSKKSVAFEAIELNSKGKYLKFLHEFGKNKPWVNAYYEKFNLSLSLSPSMIWDILRHHEKFDMTDERTKLVIAIHYLSLNELQKNIQKWQRI
ncbi:MAG: hypothetical protein R3E32_26310 [Chitinophagales bacterium]